MSEQLGPTAAPGATAPNSGDQVAVVSTNYGRIVLKFFPDVAPGHVKNFVDLANDGYYDGIKFHRVIPGFMIQGGDPNTKDKPRSLHGTGGPGYAIKAEFNKIPHTRGILSAARTNDPNSAGSQFFLMHAASPHLDGQYSVYGQVIEGMDVVDKIADLPKDGKDNPHDEVAAVMQKVTIQTWPLAE